LTDFGLTLSRYYNNIVNDYFAQAVIDYVLGTADVGIFTDFEADMKSQDYAVDLRKVRQNAIDTCAKICVEESEDLISGWTLSCPAQPNTLRSLPFEECVLLLTGQALYFCSMDWATEKVKQFERIELDSIEAIARGTYITSTFASRDLNEKKNVGFVLRINSNGRDFTRRNTRSLTSDFEDHEKKKKKKKEIKNEKMKSLGDKILAFKALPPKSSFVDTQQPGSDKEPPSEVELTTAICEQIVRVVNAAKRQHVFAQQEGSEAKDLDEAGGSQQKQILEVEEKDIISASDAKKSTGYLEQLGYSLKKLVWAS
jgi:hypothetical protein